MLVYVVIFSWLGFVLSTFVVMIFLVWAVGRAPWHVSLVTALSITIASYLLFEVALDAQLPKASSISSFDKSLRKQTWTVSIFF